MAQNTRVSSVRFGSVDFLLPREHGDAGGLRNSVGHFGLYCAVEAKDGGLFSAV